ncbi:hypothetical protein FB451DRAFT_1058249, partial [Mycena latifolia]
RAHISAHILRCHRGVSEDLRVPVGPTMPCGLCGHSNRPECNIHLRRKGPTIHVETNCSMLVPFNYKPAEKGSTTTPCRNVPVICTICLLDIPRAGDAQRAQWRYNMPEHLAAAHPEYASPLSPEGIRLPHNVWEVMKLTEGEERALGIPEAKIPAIFKDIAGPDEGVDRANVTGKKRKRGGPAQCR